MFGDHLSGQRVDFSLRKPAWAYDAFPDFPNQRAPDREQGGRNSEPKCDALKLFHSPANADYLNLR